MAGTHIALLRGINVGRANRVAMADLRALLEGLGYSNVRTLLNSGNVVFEAPARAAANAASRIERGLATELGVSAPVIVLSAAELDAAIDENPLLSRIKDPSRFHVSVLADPADMRLLKPLLKQDWSPEALALGTRVAYLWCPGGILAGPLPGAVGRAVGNRVTARNWATMVKLRALALG